MATLAELWTLMEDPTLKQKVASACVIAANTISLEVDTTTNHANRLKWAKNVYFNHVVAGEKMLLAVLSANSTATLSQITGASDATIQNSVNANVNLFADGT